MTLAPIEHEAILASAGSGKTFALAHRYIHLLAAGVDPSRIIAITFSRKAAGEIYISIVDNLRQAASSAEAAQRTAERLGCPQLQQEDFLSLLRGLVDSLHRLHISTIDSFTVGILRAFPMELGVSPAFDLMDNGGEMAARERAGALSRFFQDMNRQDQARDDLMEAFKQATFGRETKTFARDFDQFIADFQTYYKLLPSASAWGSATRIWPAGNSWLACPPHSPEDLLDRLRAALSAVAWPDFADQKWKDFVEALPAYLSGSLFARVSYIGERLLAAMEELRNGQAELKMGRTIYPCEGPLAEDLWLIVQAMMQARLALSVERTQGVFRLLHQFDHLYDAQVRRMGRLTFDDAQYVIQRSGRPLSRESGDAARLYIDYRLDSGLDHWLIDEFQDTSDLQWDVFRNLADEVIQDAEGRRSFFFVGDVKQAIYGWRGGNHKLFGHILEEYGDCISRKELHVSYRSAPSVLAVVNQVFSKLPARVSELVNPQWQPFWKEHQSAPSARDIAGYSGLLEAQATTDDAATDRYRLCADLLSELDPIRRDLSVGILVRRNRVAQDVANVIRELCPEIPVIVEGQSDISDNPVVRLMLSMIRHAAHPANTLAYTHLMMSPLRTRVERRMIASTELLKSLCLHGFQASLREWGEWLCSEVDLDEFGSFRLQQLIEAAGDYDARGRRSPDEFVSFIEGFSAADRAGDSGVRVMTVHKSKGLGFDVVLMPDLPDGNGMDVPRREPLHIARDKGGVPQWALLLPDRAICEGDDILSAELLERRRDDCFENLCCLYVAMTRAKRGLYLITSPPPKSSNSLNWSGFLRLQLAGDIVAPALDQKAVNGLSQGVIFESGTWDWFQGVPTRSPDEEIREDAVERDIASLDSRRRRLARVNPSSRAEGPRPAHLFFLPTVSRSLELGTAVHGLFEQMDWYGSTSVDEAISRWRSRAAQSDPEAEDHFRQALGQAEFQSILSQPDGDVSLWRETPFEVVLDKEWVTGTFDRVMVVRDFQGNVRRAMIMDYKTNDVEDEPVALQEAASHYCGQLELYAKALSRLIRFPEERIEASLLFTRVGRVVPVLTG